MPRQLTPEETEYLRNRGFNVVEGIDSVGKEQFPYLVLNEAATGNLSTSPIFYHKSPSGEPGMAITHQTQKKEN